MLDAEEIKWIEADDYYAAIHIREERHLLRESLTSLAQRLDSAVFLRVHRSAIVNIERVREVLSERGKTVLVLRNGIRVPVSSRRRARVSRLLRRTKNQRG